MRDSRVDKLAGVLVRYSTAVRSGQLVSIVGSFPARDLLVALFRETLSAGAHPVILAAPEECSEIMLREGSDKQILFANPVELREVELADVSIHIIAPENTRALTDVDPARQALRSEGRRALMDLFLQSGQ